MGRADVRPTKLFMLYNDLKAFTALQQSKSSNYTELEYKAAVLIQSLYSFTGCKDLLPDLRIEDSVLSYSEIISNFLLESKKSIIKHDMKRLLAQNAGLAEKTLLPFREAFPDLDARLYIALRRELMPTIVVLNDQILKTANYVNRLYSQDPTFDMFSAGVAKFFIGEGIFSLRTAHSISLAESQVTKWLLYQFRRRLS